MEASSSSFLEDLVSLILYKYSFYVFIYFYIHFLHQWTETVLGFKYMSVTDKLATDAHKKWSKDI